jgi:hypothetical protein
MVALLGSDTDFVYTEMTGQGHGFPHAVIEDIFRFFDVRLLARGPGRFKPQARPLSSFERKLSRDEKRYLPSLDEADDAGGDATVEALLKELRTGGGVAEQAVPKLVAHADPKVSSRVARILLKSSSGPDVRRYAARVLAGRKAADEIDTIGRVLLIETESNALLELLDAIHVINSTDAGPHLLRFLRKRADYLASRVQGGELSHSDWITIAPTLAQACSLLGSYGTDRAVSAITSAVVDGVLLADTVVLFDTQNQDPRSAGRALATSCCAALTRLGGADARTALEKLARAAAGGADVEVVMRYGPVGAMRHWARDPATSAAVQDALRALGVH